jgi:hypothetical protein
MTATTTELDFAKKLGELLNVPLVACEPKLGEEFHYPTGERDSLTPDDNQHQLGKWKPGWAIMARTGGNVAVVDVDPRNGGDIEKARQLLDGLRVRTFAEVATPGGGRHFYIAGHPELPSCSHLDGWPGIDVLSFGKLVFLVGTQRPKYGGAGYRIVSDNLEALADGGDPDGAETFADWVAERRGKREQFQTSSPWQGGEPDARQTKYLAGMLAGIHHDLSGMGKDSGRNTAVYSKAMRCGNYIAGAGLNETASIDVLLDASRENGLVKEDGENAVLASIRSGIKNGRARPRAVPEPREQVEVVALPQPSTNGSTPPPDQRLEKLAQLLTQLRTWQHLPDPVHVIAALATAATRNIDGEPCWLLLVAPPSSGKTETARLLDDIADARLNEVTAAGLLGWSKGKIAKPSGILTKISKYGLVTFGDLSSLLATSDRGGRDQVFGMLRRIYDGHVTRDIAPPGKTDSDERLSWSGRLTVVACVTGAIDRYAAHADQLGPRWMQVRIAERATHEKRQAAKLARRGDLAAHRKSAREAVADLLAHSGWLPELPDDIADEIEDAALVTAWGRGAVPRNGYGRREIEGIPVVEEPMRLVQQLNALARGILALGLPDEAVPAITRRVALDSMPEARRAVLQALSTGEVLNTSACARRAGIDRKVARMTLEDLAAIGVVANDRQDEDDEHEGVVNWSLVGDDGDIIAGVFEAFRQSNWGWDETWVYTSTSPQIREEESTSTGGQPTLRPTPATPDNGDSPQGPQDDGLEAPRADHCSLCGAALLFPPSQERGICEKCWRATPDLDEKAMA